MTINPIILYIVPIKHLIKSPIQQITQDELLLLTLQYIGVDLQRAEMPAGWRRFLEREKQSTLL